MMNPFLMGLLLFIALGLPTIGIWFIVWFLGTFEKEK